MPSVKEELYRQCVSYVKKRIEESDQAFKDADEAANDETKSSAGDKYETGREMIQQQKDRLTTQLNEANKLLVALNRITTTETNDKADAGSLILTDNGSFYLSIGAGALNVGGESYFAISPASPIGVKLKGAKAGDSFDLNGKVYRVKEVL